METDTQQDTQTMTLEEMSVAAHQLAFYADNVASSFLSIYFDKQKTLTELRRIVELAGVLSKALA